MKSAHPAAFSRQVLTVTVSIVTGVALGIVASVHAGRESEDARIPVDEVRTFAEVLDQIRSAYIEETDDRTLLEEAIHGMLASLDPHSAYITDDAFDDLQETTTGEFGGIGIEVSMDNGRLTVIAPIDGSPAARAGIESGDVITHLDDAPVKGLRLGDAIERMRGVPGTSVTLTVVRKGLDEALTIDLTRELIHSNSVRSELLQPGYGYLRISQFQISTPDELGRAIDALEAANGGAPLDAAVLDLRNNPGGVLQAGVDVADTFLASGEIVYTKGRLPGTQVHYAARSGDRLAGAPMVVLVNGGTASASEIVAGALQDHARAVVMGTETFGKGSVQTVLPLGGQRAIKLTTALYYTPNGRSIQAHGIQPDIIVSGTTAEPPPRPRAMREQDLPGHLEAGQSAAADAPFHSSDHQLNEAVNLLRGITILSLRAP